MPLIQFLPLPDHVPAPVPAPAPAPVHVPVLPKGTKRKASREKGKLLWEILEKENQKWIDEHETEDGDLDHLNNVINETAEPPPALIMPLLRYQKEFLAWATKQEQSAARGGILADEMGMGKTIQAISLVLARREAARDLFRETMGLTLVICPLAAVSQWLDEIERYTSPGSTKVLTYHGAKKEKNAEEFKKYDFVLTTYPTVENGYRGCIASHKTEQTLEEDQIGPVVKEKPILHSIWWTRIILDEVNTRPVYFLQYRMLFGSDVGFNFHFLQAHTIKEKRSNTARAVFALDANYRWALSGTPFQNNIGELYSLVS